MTRRDLVCLLATDKPGPIPSKLKPVVHGRFTAVLGKRLDLGFVRASRKAILKMSVERQENLEQLMKTATVLPVLPGTAVTQDAVGPLIRANLPALETVARDLEGLVQFQLSISWDIQAARQHFDCHDDAHLERIKDDLAAEAIRILAPLCSRLQELPREDQMISNYALLLPVHQEPDLDACAEQIDAIWTDGLKIRLVGPSPAVSFASLGFRKITARACSAALQMFGFQDVPDPETLQSQRRSHLLRSASDHHRDIKNAAEIVSALTRLGHVSPFHQAYIWEEGRAAPQNHQRAVA